MSANDVQYRFELAVTKLQEDLQYLADHGKVSQSFINKRNQHVKCLIEYYEQSQIQIESLELELANEQHQKSRLVKSHLMEKEKLEAVCLLHGITDLASWMVKPLPLLVWYVTQLYEMGGCLLPQKWGERFSAAPKYLKAHIRTAMSFAYDNWFLNRKKEIDQEILHRYAATQRNKQESRENQKTPAA